MERLTDDRDFCLINNCSPENFHFCDDGFCIQRQLWDRLKAYEDTGVTPEQVQKMRWIPVAERMPEEHDSVFAKDKGTNRWSPSMWEKQSAGCNVVIQFEDGSRMVTSCRTQDGKWARHPMLQGTVTHWMPKPELPEVESDER